MVKPIVKTMPQETRPRTGYNDVLTKSRVTQSAAHRICAL